MRILIVDDEEKICLLLREFLSQRGYEVHYTLDSGRVGRMLERNNFDVVITDLKMQPVDGMELLKFIKKKYPETYVIIMTAFGTVKNAVQAMKEGAFDYLVKPFSLDELEISLKKIEDKIKLEWENKNLREGIARKYGEIIGKSEKINEIKELIIKVAPMDTTVLITGETGTGKELVARKIHEMSPRSPKPFVAVNISAFPDTLIESELFGYEKGAFTGASSPKPGLFEIADGGTLFIDEIGELSKPLQAKLLRVLQDRKITRLGSTREIELDVRIICATNRNLEKEVVAGNFREDLYYRIAVFPIHLPPLRERIEDIPLLVEHILRRLGHKRGIEDDALSKLMSYDWPGNVRELENVLERAMILSGGEIIKEEHVLLKQVKEDINIPKSMSLEELEKNLIIKALQESGGNRKKAAELLGISRKMLYTRLKKYNLE